MHSIISRLEQGLIPAVPVPFAADGHPDLVGQRGYAEWLAARRPAGVAVWAHTGRGLYLTPAVRGEVLSCWRDALPGAVIVAGVGITPGGGSVDDTVVMARAAKASGADALLVHPPPGGEKEALTLHRALAVAELPCIAFYLYRAAGGVTYSDTVLRDLLNLPNVIGLKVATLDSVMTFQHLASVVGAMGDSLLITGEDRFLGYSLMMGARAALVGMAAALTDVQIALLRAWGERDLKRFHRLTALCDRFGQVAFSAPIDGYIQRLLWAAAAEGAIPLGSCHDPWGPVLPAAERHRVETCVREIRTEWSR